MKNNKNLLYILGSIIFFALVALIYCAPVLSGKSIIQPDIINYRGSAEEMLTYQEQTNEHVYWSNAMFGGMPTYQTGAQYDFDLIKGIDKVIRFLPRPADYIFLLFSGFFILGLTLFKKWKYALTGSVFFAVGAYFFIIIAAGHNAKVHTIAYFPPLVAGILLLYRKKYIPGFVLTTLFMGLQLQANHIQMTFYLFLVMLVFVIFQFYSDLKTKQIPAFFKASGLVVVACIIALGLNASRLLATYEYSKETTRGKSEMSLLKTNTDGLDHDYITQWSYGKLETLNLFIPNLMGGSSMSTQEDLKNYYSQLQSLAQQVGDDEFNQQVIQALAQQPRSTYWGEQPGTSGPAYQGAIVVFLFILGLFLVRGRFGKYKWWLLSATILSILLAWGKNFQFLTDVFVDYFPMYDKFRAVSSILVMAELTMPLLAIITVYYFIQENDTAEHKTKMLTIVGGTTIGILAILYIGASGIFSFQSSNDTSFTSQFLSLIGEANPNAIGFWQSMLKQLDDALIADRVAMFRSDTLRTIIFVLLTFALLYSYQKKYIKNSTIVVLSLGALALLDGYTVNKRYFNDDNFVSSYIVDNPFPTELSVKLESEANSNNNVAQIAYKVPLNKALSNLAQKDQSQFRVYNTTQSTFNDAGTSFFVNSIGGYHAAKLGKYQDLIDIYFSGDERLKQYGITDESGMINVLNMLNTKYIIHGNIQEPKIELNPTAFGNAWFVGKVKSVNNANEEILALNDTYLDKQVILRNEIAQNLPKVAVDSTASIQLTSYTPTKMVYKASTNTDQIAVFSEIYYPHGWKASVDGKEVDILKANYILRALPIAKGQHEIVFTYEPQVITTGKTIMLVSNALLIIVIVGGTFLGYKKCKKENYNFKTEEAPVA
ncbi:MAG: YfhO family protein [Flavobacteriaceae bacterium]|nr:YfhO family protein [Candidatus Onthonaster equi]